jgi:hypothetical protein
MKTIPQGYQIQIHSWENDSDHRRVKTISGLTKEDVQFYIELTKLFYSMNAWGTSKGFGNSAPNPHDLNTAVIGVINSHPSVSVMTHGLWNDPDFPDDIDIIYDTLIEFVLGFPEDYDNVYFCRVFESMDIYFVPNDIKEISSEFTK